MRGLDGKVVIITGAGRGIGAAAAVRLAEEGATVAVSDIDGASAEDTAATIRRAGGRAAAFRVDVSKEDEVRAFVAGTVAEFGGIDRIFSNAADLSLPTYSADTDVVDLPLDIWHHALAVNLTGTFHVLRHGIPALLRRGGGAIVCTGADGFWMAERHHPAYQSSKAGIMTLVRHVSRRWGMEGIRANVVSPALIMSEAQEQITPPDLYAKYLAMGHTGKTGRPKHIAAMVAFLLSDDAEHITGQVYSVNGGLITV